MDQSASSRVRHRLPSHLVAALLLFATACMALHGAPLAAEDSVPRIEGDGWVANKIDSNGQDGLRQTGVFDGDTYSFQHQLGALIDGIFQCFSPQGQGDMDNTVLFDGLSELLDPYLDGTQPLVFEFETSRGTTTKDVSINSFSELGGDLFPEGFEDPDTGTPLTDACIEIGIDDTLDSNTPITVSSALLTMSNDMGPLFANLDITSFFSNPWDGRLSIVFSGLAGQDINGTVLNLSLEQFEPKPIFADGFESGDASAWQ